jgi:hypothetical protein
MPDIVYIEKLGDAMAPVGLREDPPLNGRLWDLGK